MGDDGNGVLGQRSERDSDREETERSMETVCVISKSLVQCLRQLVALDFRLELEADGANTSTHLHACIHRNICWYEERVKPCHIPDKLVKD